MNTDRQRRLAWLWKNRHTHDGDDTQSQITIIQETIERVQEVAFREQLGAYIHFSRAAPQSIAVAGEAISWDTQLIPAANFPAHTLPTTQITIQESGYYNVGHLDGDWVSWASGGSVWVTRERGGVETTVAPLIDGFWTAARGTGFRDFVSHAIPCQTGDILRVYVDHGDVSAQDLAQASVAVYLVDRVATSDVATYRETVLADTPVAYWRLGELESVTIAKDETGNGHDGVYDAAVTQGVPGLLTNDPNLAAQFTEGSGGIVEVPIHADLKFLDADFSLEAWIKMTASVTADVRFLSWSSGGARQWTLYVITSGTPPVRISAERNGVAVVQAGSGDHFDFDTNHHVVATYDATSDEMILYLDGVAVDSGTSSGALTDGAAPVRIGGGSSNEIDGVVDEAAVYGYPLTPSQILLHYQAGTH